MKLDLGVLESADADSVNNDLDEIWSLLLSDPETRSYAEDLGLDLSSINEIVTNPFRAEQDRRNRAGVLETVLIGVVVSIASDLAKSSLEKIWKRLIKPKLETHYGRIMSDD